MKKLILKTTAITLGIIVGLIFFVYGIIGIFSPVTLGHMYKSLGNHDKTIKYYCSAFDKSASFDHLVLACNEFDEIKDCDKAEEYLEIFINHYMYTDYCSELDSEIQPQIPSRHFYRGKYANAVYNKRGLSNGKYTLAELLDKTGYIEYNCIYMIITNKNNTFTNQDVHDLDKIIKNFTAATVSETRYINRDLALLDEIQQELINPQN